MRHLELIADGVVATVKEFVASAIAATAKRLDDLEQRITAIPAGKDGEPGPQGEKGAQGEPGAAGERGDNGAPGKDASVDFGALAEQCRTLIAALPRPKDGEPGKDGKSLTPDDAKAVIEPLVAAWALDFERRAQDVFAQAIERIPAPANGKDGLGFDDLSLDHDGDGGVKVRFVRGEQTKEFELRFPCFRYRDAWNVETKDYREGHAVTRSGSIFIAKKDDPQGEPGDSDDWRLAVKRGRDGKDGRAPPPSGPVRL